MVLSGVPQAFISVVLWAFMGLMAAAPVLKIIHLWLIDRQWNAAQSLGTLLAAFALLCLLWRGAGIPGAFGLLAILFLLTLLSPLFERRAEKRVEEALRDEDIERCKRAIAHNPDNAAAHAFLADAYMAREQYEDAVTEYEQAVALDPSHTYTEQYKLRKARDAAQGHERKPIAVCEQCHCETPADAEHCRKCGAPLHIDFIAWLLDPQNFKPILRQSAIVTLIIMILGMIFSSLPYEIKGCVIMSATIVLGFLLIRRVGGN